MEHKKGCSNGMLNPNKMCKSCLYRFEQMGGKRVRLQMCPDIGHIKYCEDKTLHRLGTILRKLLKI